MKLIIVAALCCAALGAQAQAHKCVGPTGKVEYLDTARPNDTKSTVIRTDRPNSLDTSHSHYLNQVAGAAQDCQTATETLRHNDSRVNKEMARRACASPDSPKRSNDEATIQRAASDDATMKKLLDSQKKYHESMNRLGEQYQRSIKP